jgi:4-hydroxy-3-methylbut-2-enyl diphosphate reductase
MEVAGRLRGARSILVSAVEQFDWLWAQGMTTLGLTSAASTPEYLVQAFIDSARSRFEATIERLETATETTRFRAPAIQCARPSRGQPSR